MSTPLLLVAGVALASMFGLQILLSVVPPYADRVGSAGAGLATASFTLSTVFTQVQMPWLLGLPAFLYPFSDTLEKVHQSEPSPPPAWRSRW